MNLFLTFVLLLASIAEVWSTNKAVKLPQLQEVNKVVKAVMSKLGKYWWVIKIPVVGLFGYMSYYNPYDTTLMMVLLGGSLLTFWVAYNNWKLHQKYYK